MDKGLVKVNWEDISNLAEEDITYFLSLEGKSIDTICRIRKMQKEEVQRHIIEGKVKYRFFVRSKNEQELFATLCNAVKDDKISVLQSIDEENKRKLLLYLRKNYMDMPSKFKETAVWIIGELRALEALDILTKATVHKHVNIRRMAVSAMGKIGEKSCEMPLLRALEDENPQVVMYAIKSLSKIKSERALDKVKLIYNSESKEYLKRAAEEFIQSLEK